MPVFYIKCVMPVDLISKPLSTLAVVLTLDLWLASDTAKLKAPLQSQPLSVFDYHVCASVST